MLRVAVIDDEKEQRDLIGSYIERYAVEHGADIDVQLFAGVDFF